MILRYRAVDLHRPILSAVLTQRTPIMGKTRSRCGTYVEEKHLRIFFGQLGKDFVHGLARLSPWCPEVCDRHSLEVGREHLLEVFRRIDCHQIQRHEDAEWVQEGRGEEKGARRGGERLSDCAANSVRIGLHRLS